MVNATPERHFLSIVGWDDFQYADTRKKPEPPWRWCRLPRILMDSPDFQAMTMAQRGAFCWLLLLASETGNLIPDESRFLRNRIQLDARLRRSLIDLGVIEQIALPPDSPQVKALRRIYSGGGPEQVRTVEKEGEQNQKEILSPKGTASVESSRRSPCPELKKEQPKFEELTRACQEAGVSGSNWQAIGDVIAKKFGVLPTQKQFRNLEQQLNDRSGK